MPCYLFTYHGKGTWMPDHPRGYVHRTYGLQPADSNMAAHYRFQQRDSEEVQFSTQMQLVMIATARNAGRFIDAIVHGVALESTHIHVLISWKHKRDWKSIRASLRRALTRALNDSFEHREWFSDSPSRKRVRDHEHFDYLMLVYLPNHTKCWLRDDDQATAEARDAKRPQSVRTRRKTRKSSDGKSQ